MFIDVSKRVLQYNYSGRNKEPECVSMGHSHLSPPKRSAEAKPVAIYTGTAGGHATMLGLHP